MCTIAILFELFALHVTLPIVGGLPFLYPSSYNVLSNTDDSYAFVTLPTPLQFGNFHYKAVYVSGDSKHGITLYSTD